MPNGHGGIPRWGGAVGAALLLAFFLWTNASTGAEWTRYVGAAAAGLFGWRFSWHYWMYPLEEYGGAYHSEEGLKAGRTLHRITTAVLVPGCALAAWWWWP